MEYDLCSYYEEKPHRIRRIIWYFLNSLVYPLFMKKARTAILRFAGAKIGRMCLFYRSVRVYAPWLLEIGDKVCVGPRVNLYNKGGLKIGSNVVISQDVFICTASHDIKSPVMKMMADEIRICDKVWIAAKATILPGVTIGEGAVVGACAVVAKDIPPWSVAVGNPARVVGARTIHYE